MLLSKIWWFVRASLQFYCKVEYIRTAGTYHEVEFHNLPHDLVRYNAMKTRNQLMNEQRTRYGKLSSRIVLKATTGIMLAIQLLVVPRTRSQSEGVLYIDQIEFVLEKLRVAVIIPSLAGTVVKLLQITEISKTAARD